MSASNSYFVIYIYSYLCEYLFGVCIDLDFKIYKRYLYGVWFQRVNESTDNFSNPDRSGVADVNIWSIFDNRQQRLALLWRHNGHDGVSNHQPHHCLLNRLFGRRSQKTLKLRVTGLCEGNSPLTGEFPAQKASNVENVYIWWRHHEKMCWRVPSTGITSHTD